MNSYEITTEMRGTEKVLLIKHNSEEYLNDYLVKMIEYNSIKGILPLKTQNLNGSTILNYKIGNKFKLIDLIEQNNIGPNEVRLIYLRLTEAIIGMEEYFLKAEQCIYNLEYLYVDNTLNPYLIYLPLENIKNQDLAKVWKEFFLSLLSYFANGKEDIFYDKLMRYLIQPNFDIKKFNDFLLQINQKEESKVISLEEQRELSPKSSFSFTQTSNEISATKEIETDFTKEKVMLSVPSKNEKEGLVIPGMQNKVKIEKKEDKPKEKKKGISLFGFGKKKEKVEKNIPQIPNKIEKQAEIKLDDKNTDNGEWSKTVFIKPDENCTVMLSSEEPHLMHGGMYIPLSQFPFSIGKSSASYIVSNPTVSRRHAVIIKQGEKYFIQDENSVNHTYVNGQIIGAKLPVELHEGDIIRLSNEEFTFFVK